MFEDDDDNIRPATPSPTGEGVRILGAEEAAVSVNQPRSEGEPTMAMRFPLPDDAMATAPSAPELPHWSEPPTGELPLAFAGGDDDWAAATGPVWRDGTDDWDDAGLDDVAEIADDIAVGALDSNRSESSDLFSFDFEDDLAYRDMPSTIDLAAAERQDMPIDDEEDELVAIPARRTSAKGRASSRMAAEPDDDIAPPAAPTRRGAPSRAGVPGRRSTGMPGATSQPRQGRDVPAAIATGAGLAVAATVAFILGPTPTFIVVFAAVMLCAVELFDSLRRAGHQPVTLVGLVAVAGLMIGTFAGANVLEGERVVPLVLALSVITLLGWHLVGASRAPVTSSVSTTMLGIVWVGVLGSFAANLLNLPNRAGIAILAVAAIGTIAHDIGGFVFGMRFGRTPLAPSVSPSKTLEGLLGGMLAALFVTGIVGSQISPIAEAGLAEWKLGIVIALVAPFGDLVESLVKRDLRLKDTGSILPGHGGVFDRFDALLCVLPVVYYLSFVFNIV